MGKQKSDLYANNVFLLISRNFYFCLRTHVILGSNSRRWYVKLVCRKNSFVHFKWFVEWAQEWDPHATWFILNIWLRFLFMYPNTCVSDFQLPPQEGAAAGVWGLRSGVPRDEQGDGGAPCDQVLRSAEGFLYSNSGVALKQEGPIDTSYPTKVDTQYFERIFFGSALFWKMRPGAKYIFFLTKFEVRTPHPSIYDNLLTHNHPHSISIAEACMYLYLPIHPILKYTSNCSPVIVSCGLIQNINQIKRLFFSLNWSANRAKVPKSSLR